jgi:hypothetical protein
MEGEGRARNAAALERFLEGAEGEQQERQAVESRVESIFDELKLDWKRGEGPWEWQISADIGHVLAGLDEQPAVLTFIQILNRYPGSAEQQAEILETLLRLNSATTGATFAIQTSDDGTEHYFVLLARVAATSLDTEEVALAVKSLFDLSGVLDEAGGENRA